MLQSSRKGQSITQTHTDRKRQLKKNKENKKKKKTTNNYSRCTLIKENHTNPQAQPSALERRATITQNMKHINAHVKESTQRSKDENNTNQSQSSHEYTDSEFVSQSFLSGYTPNSKCKN